MKAILTIAGAALACAIAAGPAAADDGAPQKRTEKIVIIERDGAHADGGERHRVMVEALGGPEGRCDGNKDEVNSASPDGKQRTRILVCTNGNLSAAERADKLEHVLARLETRDDLNADQKARVTASLREAIERLRAGQ